MTYEIEVPALLPKVPLSWDLETIGNPDAIESLPEPEPKANLKDPAKIEADIAEKKEKAISKMGLNGNTALICACGFAGQKDDGEVWSDALLYDPKTGEKEFVGAIWDVLVEASSYVTFNGLGFDLPMLLRRSLVCDLIPPIKISTHRYNVPPQGNHYDLLQIIGGYGNMATGSFDHLCEAVLGEGKPEGIDGSQVQGYWDAGKREAIRLYAKDDAEQNLRLWQRAKGIYF